MLKSTAHLYRDCLRTIEHMNGRSAKGRHITAIVRQQFKDNKHITDEQEIETLRKNAMTSLANYLTLQSISALRHKDGQGNPLSLANAQQQAEEAEDEYEEVWMNEHGDILTDEEAEAIQRGATTLKDAEVQSDTRHRH